MNSQHSGGPVQPQGSRSRWVLRALLAATLASCLMAVCIGPSRLGPGRVARLLWQRASGATVDPADTSATILFHVRLPRVCLALAVGASLALAGLAMQTLFRNPLASPCVLGVSSGAAFGAALVMLAAESGATRAIGIPPAAVTVGMGTSLLVYAVARSSGGFFAHTLLLAGMAVAALFSALVSLVTYLSGEGLRELVFWLMGGLWRATWRDVILVSLATLAGYAALHALRRPLDVLALGDRGVSDVGLNVRRTKEVLLIIGTVLAAIAVAVSGMIGFVGLMVPHLARLVVGHGHRRLVPACALGGALLLVWADTLARTVREPVEVPVGIVTALLGAPFFLFLLHRAAARRRMP